MSLIKIEHLTFSYDGTDQYIFKDFSFYLDSQWRTGLIGRNGIGKSTLFKLLLGQELYYGKISANVEFVLFPPDVLCSSKSGVQLFKEHAPDSEEWELSRELSLLKLDDSLVERDFQTLSKGEQMKLLLAILFTKKGGYLLIDEPTNHLDMDGREIVAEYLQKKEGFLLISHDRDFLDRSVDHILSLNRQSFDIQSGNFSSWYQNKMMKDQYEIRQNERLKKEIKKLNQAAQQNKLWSDKIEKTKNGTKIGGLRPDRGYIGRQSAKMMRNVKQLERRQNQAIDQKEKLLKDLENAEPLLLHSLDHPKNCLLSVRNLSASYGERQVFSNLNLDIHLGDRISINGANGSGKTTLLNILLGFHQDYSGEVKKASDLQISSIPQDIRSLRGNLDTYIQQQNVDLTLCKAILRKLNFSRELFEIDLQSYSDGQKKEVLIAVSLSKPAHLFIWDEPLNYVDWMARVQIEEMIKTSTSTILFVEHDRRFVDNVANRVLEL